MTKPVLYTACKDCKKPIPQKILAYYANGQAVYWPICEKCMRKKYRKKGKKFEIS